MNLFQSFEKSAQNYPEKTAILFGEQRISYRELLEKVNRLSAGLDGLGLKKGDWIAALMPNRPEAVLTYYAAMKLGLIYVGLNIMLKNEELDYILDDCRPKAVVASVIICR